MAEEPQPAAPAETVVVPSEIPAEKSAEKDPPTSVPEAEAELSKPASETETATESGDKKPGVEKQTAISESVSFKEESNRVSDLPDPHKKALEELKQLIQEALNKHEFTAVPPPKEEEAPKAEAAPEEPPKAEPEAKAEADEAVKPAAVEEAVTADRSAPAVDDDGAKTVEAIEETVVSVAAVPPPVLDESLATPPVAPEEVFIWGVPLIGDEKSDVVLLKFLRARDFKAKDAFCMIKNTVLWRKEFSIDTLLEEDLGNDLEKVVFMHGVDKEGHQVCYNVYGEFQNKELYDKSFSDAEKRQKFLRWRIQFLEKSIRQQLDFTPDGICSFFQVTDLRNSPGPGKKELRQATNQALNVLQDNYPEFVAKQVFINVPWWYVAFNRMISPFLTQRTKSKFVFAGPSKSSETLFRYIAPEQVPVQYGGMSKEDGDFTIADPVTEITIKPASKHCIEFPATEPSLVVWELRVLGWDVSYGAEFVPSAEDGYTVIVQKTRKISPSDEPVIKNSFKIGEPGKVVLTIDNTSSKKKKLLYRSKSKTASGSI